MLAFSSCTVSRLKKTFETQQKLVIDNESFYFKILNYRCLEDAFISIKIRSADNHLSIFIVKISDLRGFLQEDFNKKNINFEEHILSLLNKKTPLELNLSYDEMNNLDDSIFLRVIQNGRAIRKNQDGISRYVVKYFKESNIKGQYILKSRYNGLSRSQIIHTLFNQGFICITNDYRGNTILFDVLPCLE